jgi:hypothetical protein
MAFTASQPPTSKQFLRNMEEKMLDDDFLGDMGLLIRPDETYNPNEAWQMIRSLLIEKIKCN